MREKSRVIKQFYRHRKAASKWSESFKISINEALYKENVIWANIYISYHVPAGGDGGNNGSRGRNNMLAAWGGDGGGGGGGINFEMWGTKWPSWCRHQEIHEAEGDRRRRKRCGGKRAGAAACNEKCRKYYRHETNPSSIRAYQAPTVNRRIIL